jgi:hypothetical protein
MSWLSGLFFKGIKGGNMTAIYTEPGLTFGLHILKNPAGTYSYVGNVPMVLTHGKNHNSITFESYESARAFAKLHGFTND